MERLRRFSSHGRRQSKPGPGMNVAESRADAGASGTGPGHNKPPAHAPIRGSCLCSSIQYEVRFPEQGDWPPRRSSCHCPQCRHQSGSLVLHMLNIPASNLIIYDPTLSLREFASSPPARRAFCSRCGSTLFWRKIPDMPGSPTLGSGAASTTGSYRHRHHEAIDDDDPDAVKTTQVAPGSYDSHEGIDVFLGTLDEKVLKSEDGRILATPADGVLWAGDMIPGVTDNRVDGEGKRWLKATGSGEV